MKFWGMALVLVVVLIFSSSWMSQAQQAGAQGGGGGRGQQTPEQAALQAARVGNSVTVPSEGVNAAVRKFEAGNRTYWHKHEGGFIFFVQAGRGRVQRRGEPMKELGPGEVDFTPPGVEHWHGAAPNESLLQLGIVTGPGPIEFHEPVTDAQYQGKAK